MLGFLGLVIGTHPRVLDADEGLLLGLGTVNLLHAATSGGLYGLMIQRIDKNYYDLDSMLSGAIAGMVTHVGVWELLVCCDCTSSMGLVLTCA